MKEIVFKTAVIHKEVCVHFTNLFMASYEENQSKIGDEQVLSTRIKSPCLLSK